MKTPRPARSLVTHPAPAAMLSGLPEVPTQQPLVLDAAKIDWAELKQHKLTLARLVMIKTYGLSRSELEAVEGLLSFLDYVEDTHLEP
jgi:hypothetical protein